MLVSRDDAMPLLLLLPPPLLLHTQWLMLLVLALLLLLLLHTLAMTMLPGSGTTGAAPLATTCTTACQDSSKHMARYPHTTTLC
jgi:hypothetical protein